MANVNIQDVKELRDMTGCGLSDCKKALEEADGNREEAVKILREKGLAKAAKKAGRIAAEGIVKTKVVGNKGVIVEINCETDFAAKSDKFLDLVETITDTILESDAADVEALKAVAVKGSDMTVEAYMTDKIATIGENMNIRRFQKLEGILIPYMHDGGRLGTIVRIETDKPDDAEVLACAKNVALQATAMGAEYVRREDIPADVLATEKEVQTKLVEQEGKPANVAEKIVEGRIRKFYEEKCLLDQEYFKDTSLKVGKYIEGVAKAQGCSIKIDAFVRYERGEGIEKKEENFADEVASMIK
ncbi:MAG: translation elongation factor Ts [Lachnospiraceae bacterium]|nr:translation elongation factor Ts [Ruminococcus sp.]MCM1274604.1 translation elongation factor Ts [Lachnospiraceae bacterium]